MKYITVYTNKKGCNELMKLAQKLKNVKKIETGEVDEEDTQEEIMANLREAFAEMKLIEAGKSKTTSMEDFLKEL